MPSGCDGEGENKTYMIRYIKHHGPQVHMGRWDGWVCLGVEIYITHTPRLRGGPIIKRGFKNMRP